MAAPKPGVNPDDTAADETQAASPSTGKGDLYVLVDAFNARDNAKDVNSVHRYGSGQKFVPVDGVTDVDALIAQKVIGYADADGQAQRTTALQLAQATARYNQEDSPVIDLRSQPFEQAPTVEDTGDASTE